MSSKCQLCVLLQKNYIIHRRELGSVIILTFIFASLLAVVLAKTDFGRRAAEIFFISTKSQKGISKSQDVDLLHSSATTSLIKEMLKYVEEDKDYKTNFKFLSFADEESMLDLYVHNKSTDRSLIALLFDKNVSPIRNTTLTLLPYMVRSGHWDLDKRYVTHTFTCTNPSSVYKQTGVSSLLSLMAEFFYKRTSLPMKVVSQPFGCLPSNVPKWLHVSIRAALPIIIILCHVPTTTALVYYMAEEKEQGLMETLPMLGIPIKMYLLSWILFALPQPAIIACSLTIAVYFPSTYSFFDHVDPFVFGFFTLTYGLTVTAHAFTVHVIVSTAKQAVWLMVALHFFQIGPFVYNLIMDHQITDHSLSRIFFIVDVCIGLSIFYAHEDAAQLLSMDSIWVSKVHPDGQTIGDIWLILLGLTLCNVMVTAIIFSVAWWPNWCFSNNNLITEQEKDVPVDDNEKPSNEDEPYMELFHVSQYRYSANTSKKYSLNNVSLVVPPKKTTVIFDSQLLDGKSSFISTITGALTPKEGRILVKGLHFKDARKDFFKNTGASPNSKLLFKRLTVAENLRLFAKKLKLLKGELLKEELFRVVNLFHLAAWLETKVKDLLKERQKVVSVALAFIGKPEFVILEEPTDGLTATFEHMVLHAIKNAMANATMFISTTRAAVVESLADRVGVMLNASLVLCGSKHCVKQMLGVGHYLSINLQPECNLDFLYNCLHVYLPDSSIMHQTQKGIVLLVSDKNRNQLEYLTGYFKSPECAYMVQFWRLSDIRLEAVLEKVRCLSTMKSLIRRMANIRVQTMITYQNRLAKQGSVSSFPSVKYTIIEATEEGSYKVLNVMKSTVSLANFQRYLSSTNFKGAGLRTLFGMYNNSLDVGSPFASLGKTSTSVDITDKSSMNATGSSLSKTIAKFKFFTSSILNRK